MREPTWQFSGKAAVVGEWNDVISHDPVGVVATACLQREMARNTGSITTGSSQLRFSPNHSLTPHANRHFSSCKPGFEVFDHTPICGSGPQNWKWQQLLKRHGLLRMPIAGSAENEPDVPPLELLGYRLAGSTPCEPVNGTQTRPLFAPIALALANSFAIISEGIR
jgi:hypothetical protein